jgi:hypothetical protein
VAVELAYGESFDLTADDADILIQLNGSDVMWQKERLLNIAIEVLPEACRKIAWLDCDIVFENYDRVEDAVVQLERLPIVQLFEHIHYMPRDLPTNALSWCR